MAGNAARVVASDAPAWGVAAGPSAPAGLACRGWIESLPFDLSFFTLSPLAGLAVVLSARASHAGFYVILLATYLVAIPHYVSSFSFYLGDENLAYYRTRRLAFFAGPIVILLSVLGLRLLKFDAIVQSTMYVWNIYHVSLQSAGILSIYRRLNGGAFSEGRFARASILSVNSTMALWNIDRFAPLYGLLHRIHFPVWTLRPALLSLSIVAVGLYLKALGDRTKRLSTPELCFIASTFVMFQFFVWLRDLNLATFAMLMGHFLQYLGIVWLLNRRKYGAPRGSQKQRLLSALSTRTPLLLLSIFIVGAIFFVAQRGSAWLGIPITYVVLWNALVLVHFYMDGLIWAFKDPFVRKSIGPYLTPESHMAIQ
jgi:hypothetical protein